jgi:hypothetical protein
MVPPTYNGDITFLHHQTAHVRRWSPNGLAEPRPTSDAHFKRPHLDQLPNSPTSLPSLGSVIDAVREVAEGRQQG